MSAPPQRMDDLQANADSSATVDPVGIKQFIADRQNSIDRISIELLKEEERVSNCVEAIKDLELAISQRTTAIEAHEKYIAALDLIQSRTKEQGTVRPAQESRLGALHRGKVRSSSRTAFDSGTVGNEFEEARRELQELRCSLVELGLELDSWRDLHELSTAAVESLASHKAKQEEIIEKGRMRGKQRVMWKFPIGVWNKIFKLTMEAGVKDLHNGQYLTPFHFGIPTLSQVCRAWSSMVAIMPELMSYIPVPPRRLDDPSDDGFLHFVSKAQAPITFLCRLSANHSTSFWPPNINDAHHSILDGKPYTLLLYDYNGCSEFARQIAGIPLKQPTSIVLVMSEYFDYISGYLHSVFPALTTLNLVLQDIEYEYRVHLDEIFVASLKELHIRVKSGAERLCLDRRVTLDNLQVFGITQSDESIIQMVEATALRTLIFYSQNDQRPPWIIRPLNEKYNPSWLQLSCLELHDWNDRARGPYATGTAAVLRTLVPSMPALKSVRLVGGSINGEELVKAMTELAPRKFELTLAYTSGITRDQCDQLKPLTSQLHIYV